MSDNPRPVYRGKFRTYGLGSVDELDVHLVDLAAALGHYQAALQPKMVARVAYDYTVLQRLRPRLASMLSDLDQLRAAPNLYLQDVTGWFS